MARARLAKRPRGSCTRRGPGVNQTTPLRQEASQRRRRSARANPPGRPRHPPGARIGRASSPAHGDRVAWLPPSAACAPAEATHAKATPGEIGSRRVTPTAARTKQTPGRGRKTPPPSMATTPGRRLPPRPLPTCTPAHPRPPPCRNYLPTSNGGTGGLGCWGCLAMAPTPPRHASPVSPPVAAARPPNYPTTRHILLRSPRLPPRRQAPPEAAPEDGQLASARGGGDPP